MRVKYEAFYEQFITYEGYKSVLDGLKTTLVIAVCGLIIGILIGALIAAVKVIPNKGVPTTILAVVGNIYVGFFRGTPIVVQLLLGYYVLLPALGITMDTLAVAIIIYGMNSGAYVAEIMRSGIQSVDGGQLEAARALGLSFPRSMLRVVIPQAIKNILPTLGNEFIVLIKETSVVSFISIVDLTEAFTSIGAANYEYIIPYLTLAAVYLVLVIMITLVIRLIERRMAVVDRNR